MTLDESFEREAAKLALHRIFRKLHKVFLIAKGEDAEFWKREGFARASGAVECPECGFLYYQHTVDPFAPWLNVLCDGRRVKL